MREHTESGGWPSALAAAVGAALVIAAPAGAQTWRELGPAPISGVEYTGRVSAVACSPTDPDLYYAAGADGGVWRTTDGGASWTPLTDRMPTTAIGALAIDPSDEAVVYAGTGEANFANHSRYGLGIYKTTDGGQTWAHLAEETFAGRCFSRIVVDPESPQRLYAAVTRAGGFPELAAAKGHPGATGPVGVFRSDDGGATWTHLTAGLPALSATDLAIDPRNPSVLYAAIGRIFGSTHNGVYKSTDGGESWVRLNAGPASANVGRIDIALAPSDPDRIYALLTRAATPSGGGASTFAFMRSNDAGATWASHIVPSIQATYGWYVSSVSVKPDDPDVVLLGGVPLVRSVQGGTGGAAAWSTVTPPHVDIQSIAWDAAGRLVVGDDGGVHRSADLGHSWTSLNTGLGLIQFYAGLSLHPSDERIVIGGTQDNGTNLRGGAVGEWLHVLGGDGGWTQINQISPSAVYAESQGTGNLYRSFDGGHNYQRSSFGIDGSDRNCFLPPYLIDPSEPSRMLYATHRVYESTDGGGQWRPISGDLTGGPPAAIRSLAIAPSDAGVVYAATNDGIVLASQDGGATFERVLEGVPGWPRVTREIVVHPEDPMTVYLAVAHFGTERVRRSTDGGATWESLGGDLPDIPVNVLAVDASRGPPALYAGTDAGVYHSRDDGATWRRYGCGLPNACVVDLRLDPARDRLIAGTQGRGAWSVALRMPADWNGDGGVDATDLFAFLTDFFAGSADFDGDGRTEASDFFAFLGAFFDPCG